MLPTGTVTFLFTDIQGSVTLWERMPELMAAALQIHTTVVRQAIQANGGIVFKRWAIPSRWSSRPLLRL